MDNRAQNVYIFGYQFERTIFAGTTQQLAGSRRFNWFLMKVDSVMAATTLATQCIINTLLPPSTHRTIITLDTYSKLVASFVAEWLRSLFFFLKSDS